MHELLKISASALPLIAVFFLCLVLIANIYKRIRRKFPLNVNCWFCNSWTKVPYDNWDNFDCPSCLQYNGFTKDGGYNKIIPEQHNSLLNGISRQFNNKPLTPSFNGLCIFCNKNQQLKVYQLAHFVPMKEENYDIEIEHFQKQLDKAYKLCRNCNKTVKATIEKQNAHIFGRFLDNNLKKKAQNSNIVNTPVNSILLKITRFLTTLFSLLLLCLFVLSNISYLDEILPNSAVAYWQLIEQCTVINITQRQVEVVSAYIPLNVENKIGAVLSTAGCILQTILIWDKYTKDVKVNQVLCWIILFLTTWIKINEEVAFVNFVQIFSVSYIIHSMFNLNDKQLRVTEKINRKAIRRMVRNLDTTCSDSSSSVEENSAENFELSCNSSETNWNDSFQTKPKTANFSTSSYDHRNGFSYNGIDSGLNALHLDGFSSKLRPSPPRATSVFSVNSVNRPKPVLSPSKFNQNNFVGGGFWKNPSHRPDLFSRTSSESSGFQSLTSETPQFGGDFDKVSVVSEPLYYNNQPANFLGQRLYFGNENALYPVLNSNNMFLFDSMGTRYAPSVVSNTKPIFLNNCMDQRESLFKNW